MYVVYVPSGLHWVQNRESKVESASHLRSYAGATSACPPYLHFVISRRVNTLRWFAEIWVSHNSGVEEPRFVDDIIMWNGES